MKPTDYTPDAICRSLGLGCFDQPLEPGRSGGWLRLLFCPSFDPEVCVTLLEENGGIRASVATSRIHIWTLAAPCLVTVDRCEAILGDMSFEQIASRFRAASYEPARFVVIIDGMRVHFGLRHLGDTLSISDNPDNDSALGRLAAEIIRVTHEAIDHDRCRNGLARAGGYVGLALPVQPEPELLPVTTVGVLGEREDREQVLEALASIAAHRR